MMITFDTNDDMEHYMVENKYSIACAIVDKIVKLYPIDVPLQIMEWHCLEEDVAYDIECLPEHVCDTLEQNMEIMIQSEDYKRCSAIKKILDVEYGNV